MISQNKAAQTPGSVDPCPWEEVAEDGSNLTVDQFPTTIIVQLGNSLRREVTTSYAEECGLTVSEWRLLSLIARFASMPLAELVRASASDKALVSRTVRSLEERGYCEIQPEAAGSKKKLVCKITKSGTAIYKKVLPIAQKRQAAILSVLTKKERVVMYSALMKLHQACGSGEFSVE